MSNVRIRCRRTEIAPPPKTILTVPRVLTAPAVSECGRTRLATRPPRDEERGNVGQGLRKGVVITGTGASSRPAFGRHWRASNGAARLSSTRPTASSRGILTEDLERRCRGLVRGVRVVKAANPLAAAVLRSDPQVAEGPRVILLSGDHIDAMADASPLFEDRPFFPIDLGGADHGWRDTTASAPLANLIRLFEGILLMGERAPHRRLRPRHRQDLGDPVPCGREARRARACRWGAHSEVRTQFRASSDHLT